MKKKNYTIMNQYHVLVYIIEKFLLKNGKPFGHNRYRPIFESVPLF